MTPHEQNAYEKALKLALASGLRCSFGPAFLAQANKSKHRGWWALAAMGEMFIDKIPGIPSRRSLGLMIPRAIAGGYAAHQMMKEEGIHDPLAGPMGAVAAAGAATVAPLVRGVLGSVLGLPDALIGLAEDYLALKLGSGAVQMNWDEVNHARHEAIAELKDALAPHPTIKSEPAQLQSVGFSAGSM